MLAHPTWSRTFVNDGGPLIALPRELLRAWKGSDGPPVEGSDFGPDYWRACEASDPANVLDVGEGAGIVIGAQQGILTANWLNLPDRRGVVLVGWEFADEGIEPRVEGRIKDGSTAWTLLRKSENLANGELLLFHAACSGVELREPDPQGNVDAIIGDLVPIEVGRGNYTIDYCVLGGDSEADAPYGCVAVRWRPV